MTKVISYANVQIKYNADTTGLKTHRTDLAALTRLIRSGETEGEKFVRRIEMINRVSATTQKSQEEVARATKTAAEQLLSAAMSSGRYLEALKLIEQVAPSVAMDTKALADAFKQEQAAANQAAEALAAKKRLQADYARDAAVAKTEVKNRQQAEVQASKLEESLLQEKMHRRKQAERVSAKLDAEAAAEAERKQKDVADAAKRDADNQKRLNDALMREDMERRRAARKHSAELDKQDKAEKDKLKAEADAKAAKDAKDKKALDDALLKEQMDRRAKAASYSAKLDAEDDANRLAHIRRRQKIEARVTKEYVDEIVRNQDRESRATRKAQREVQELIERTMTIEEKRIHVINRMKIALDKGRITQEQYNASIVAANKHYAAAPRTGMASSLAGGFMGGLTPFSLTAGGIGLAAGMAAGKMVTDSVDAYSKLTTTMTKLEVVLGSTAQAAKSFGELRTISVNASLTSDAVMNAATTMAQFGVSAQELTPTMARLSEISAGNNERLQSLALAFGQVSAAGRLTGQENLQFINAGFSPLAEISRTTGKSMAELRKEMEAGKITVEMVADSFVTATEAGGRFFGMSDKMSKTFAGQMNKATNEVTKLKEELGKLFVPSEATMQQYTSMISNFRLEVNQISSGRGLGAMGSTIFAGTEFGQEMGMMNAQEIMEFQATGMTPEERRKAREAEIKVLEEQERQRDEAAAEAAKREAARRAVRDGAVGQSLKKFGDAAERMSELIGEAAKKTGKSLEEVSRPAKKLVDMAERQRGRIEVSPERQLVNTTRELAELVRAGMMSKRDAEKIIAGDLAKMDKDSIRTELPAAVSAGTKEAYEMLNRVESDIRAKQFEAQKEQVNLQKATNILLDEIKNKPAVLGIIK